MGKPLVVVLGASGFVGNAITRELASRPIRLRLVARRAVDVPEHATADVEVRTADLTAEGELARAVQDADAIIHLVAHIQGAATWRVTEDDTVAERVNLGLVHDLIAALRRRQGGEPPAVVFAGSMTQVGKPTGALITGTEPDRPATVYDRQKLAAEQALEAATAEGVLRGVTLRLATVYGQGNGPVALERGVVSAMLRKAFAGDPLTMWHDGTVARDLVCVDDVARAFAAALDHTEALTGRHWLIGTGQPTRVGDLFATIAELVADITGKPPVSVVSEQPEHVAAQDLMDFVAGTTSFGEVTGWAPQVALQSALPRAAAAMAAAAQ